ncbi:hypothetical protein DVH24_012632 [Malus domestica]|uniref:Cation/H+ exchanger transmembrane domain-containing protein n=1 Tax=Malus domestica TaxID=3750 RepID=A0A498HN52_MALDO|nr:hypothetical protein DVH24_012632 [Malus domestica]
MLRRSASSSSFGFLAVVVPALLLLSSDLLFSLSLADPLAAADDSVTEADLLLNANATESNVSLSKPKEGSFADMIDKALENEFKENDQNEATDPGSFNNSVAGQQAVLETVARVKSKKNETKEEKINRSFQLHDVFNLDNDNRGEDTPTLIDRKDNVFIISNFKSKYPVLQLDLRLISDLVVVIVSATCGGIAFACAGQPVISGYLLAGSVIGPGGFNFVSEMVQVETVAQFGVIFLLFALGLEFSTAKLRVVRAVAVPGGLLQIFLFMCLCGITASLCGGKVSEGIFVGVFLSMSSTAVVLKFLMEKNSTNALHGQVTIGTLILQDCAVGLLFALLPVLGGTSGILQGVISMAKLMVTLITFLAVLSISSRTCVPWLLKLMISLSSQTNELYQLASVAFCLLVAWCSDKLGLSLELGSFAAGVMISTTDLAQHTLEQHDIVRFGLTIPSRFCFWELTSNFQWVTHLGSALAFFSLNFGVPTEPEASELPKGLVLGRDGNINLRITPLGDWVTHPGCALASFSLNFGVPTEPEASELPKGLVLGRDENIHLRITPLGDHEAFWELIGFEFRRNSEVKREGGQSTSRMGDPLGNSSTEVCCLLQIEPIRNLFAALFLASIGMLIHVQFLWNHVDILLASVILVIIIKTIIITMVVKGFGYNNKTSFLVGISLAQIGEFAFVLLSRASNLHLVEGKLYLLLLGTTALSLVTTPFLFKLIPGLVHLGVLLRWFPPDGAVEIGFKGDNLRSDSGKRVILMVRESHDS